MRFKFTLAIRIALSLVALVGLVLLVVLFTVAGTVKDQVNHYAQEENLQIAAARADQVGEMLRGIRWQTQALAAHPALRSGDIGVATPVVHDLAATLPPEVLQLLWADTTGAYVTSTGGSGSIADRSYFQEIVQQGKDYCVSEAVISKSLKVPIVVVAVPLRAESGELNGLLGSMILLSDLAKVTAKVTVGQSGYAWIVDATGLILAHPAAEAIMQLNVTDADKTGYRGLDALGRELVKGQPGAGRAWKPDGAEVVIYHTPIPASPGWVLGISLPVAEAEAVANHIRLFLFVLLLVSLLVSVGVAALLARSLSGPLRRTAEGFRALAEGDADLRLRLKVIRDDEVGALVGNVNEFMAKLQEIIAGMKAAQDRLGRIGQSLEDSAKAARGSVSAIGGSVRRIKDQAAAQGQSVGQSAAAVEEVSSNIESLDGLIESQAASIVQASSSVEEMVGNISAIKDSAARLLHQFEDLRQAADGGRTVHAQAMEQIAAIATRSESLLEANKVIANIASQTNLLAMNAAIEAAHAGDAGRGFSVVSDEIRRLAETSSKQSRTIGQELKAVQAAMVAVLGASRASEEAFAQVSRRIADTDVIVRNVSDALVEQQEGSSQTLTALRDMNQVTQQVRAGSLEMRQGNQTILDEIGHLKASTGAIGETLGLIERESEDIARSIAAVDSMAGQTTETIQAMEGLVGRFQV